MIGRMLTWFFKNRLAFLGIIGFAWILWFIALTLSLVIINPSPPVGDELYWYQFVFDDALDFLLGLNSLEIPVHEHWSISGLDQLRAILIIIMILGLASFLIRSSEIARIILRTNRCYLVYGNSPTSDRISQELVHANLSVIKIIPRGQEIPYSSWPITLEANDANLDYLLRNPLRLNAVIASDRADLNNIQFVQRIKQQSKSLTEELSVIARIDNELLAEEVIALHEENAGALHLFILREERLLVRRALLECPPDLFIHYDEPTQLHCMVIGLESFGQELIRSLYRLCHYPHMRRPLVTGVNLKQESGIDHFIMEGQTWLDKLSFEVKQLTDHSRPAIERFIKNLITQDPDNRSRPTCIYLCLKDINFSLTFAQYLAESFRLLNQTPPLLCLMIFEQLDGEDSLMLLQKNLSRRSITHLVQPDLNADRDLFFLQTSLDQLSKQIHIRYLEDRLSEGEKYGARPALVDWDQLSEHYRESNRNQADHHFFKVRSIGYLLEKQRSKVKVKKTRVEFTNSEINQLSLTEHHRWVSERELAGWHYSDTRDDSNKKHPDLVSWNQLPDDRQEMNKSMIRALDSLFAEADYRLKRKVYLLMNLDDRVRQHFEFSEAWENALQAIYLELTGSWFSREDEQLVIMINCYDTSQVELGSRLSVLTHAQIELLLPKIASEVPWSELYEHKLLGAAARCIMINHADQEVEVDHIFSRRERIISLHINTPHSSNIRWRLSIARDDQYNGNM